MNTKSWLSAGIIFFVLSGSLHTQAFAGEKKEKKKYIQGGHCSPGNGSKKHPYNSLSDAQADDSWDVLVVLPSQIPLDGGITLRDGTKLIGDGPDPTDFIVAQNLPTITNSFADHNGGHGIVVKGNATIEGVCIKNTYGSGINFDEAKNLDVKKVLIVGHNQGSVVSETAIGDVEYLEAGGIHGNSPFDGETILTKVIIRNNNTGPGIVEAPRAGAKRRLMIDTCEVAEIVSHNTGRNSIATAVNDGIFASPWGIGTKLHIDIQNSFIHDFRAVSLSLRQNRGVVCRSVNGAEIKADIKNCMFQRVANGNQQKNWHIMGQSFVDITKVPAGIRSKTRLEVESCTFEEPARNTLVPVSAVENQTTNSVSEWVIKDCNVINLFDGFSSVVNGDGTEVGTIENNTVTGAYGFYIVATQDSPTHVALPQRVAEVTIKNNTYVGGVNFGAIAILPNFDGSFSPWKKLRLHISDNCFHGQNSGFASILGYDLSAQGAGDAEVYAHNNSFLGYNFDILDNHANVSYHLQRNWWGDSNPCNTNSDCAIWQTCMSGFCEGPDNVNNLGKGVVETGNPLTKPIKCFHRCPGTDESDSK